ncbi:MarR family transcriptional regulator [Streptomyces sp. BHT-5-2]|uniref:MarR family winged helix-turn-helix transcriptional regulator n=1 Tax=Streptomyces sp. BHT-5-2 TaxID=2866715 RepID=UPI001C8D6F6E|nr:MarR family transcriptional regulator [Streptomyces sp. BHT-5-2]QZL06409.1 MarR family transcriptional regulator [Streptomyces sp. BHT-5-2]
MPLRDELHADLEQAALPHLVSLAGHVVSRKWDRLASRQHGVSAAGVNVLLVLTRGEATHRGIARRCWVHPSTLTGVVDTLERDGLVSRHRSEQDRRQVQLTLTPQGEKTIRDIGEEIRAEFPPTDIEQDEASVAIVRAFLIELITKNYREEQGR